MPLHKTATLSVLSSCHYTVCVAVRMCSVLLEDKMGINSNKQNSSISLLLLVVVVVVVSKSSYNDYMVLILPKPHMFGDPVTSECPFMGIIYKNWSK
jgi:hypothetical protein